MTQQKKEELKKRYVDKFSKIYKSILNDKTKTVADMIDRLSLMAVCIDECEEHLTKEGLVVEMKQGTYSIDRENPYAKILDRSTKTYQSMIKQLDDMMPSSSKQETIRAGEQFAEIVAKGKKKVDLSEFC